MRGLFFCVALVACAPSAPPAPHVEFREIPLAEIARANGDDPNAPPYAMQTRASCEAGDIWCKGEDGYPAPYSDADNVGYDPASQCGWEVDVHGRFAAVGPHSHHVDGRCCDSPRAFRRRMRLPLTACPR